MKSIDNIGKIKRRYHRRTLGVSIDEKYIDMLKTIAAVRYLKDKKTTVSDLVEFAVADMLDNHPELYRQARAEVFKMQMITMIEKSTFNRLKNF